MTRKNNNADKIRRARRAFTRAKDDIARIIATEALEHFNDSFQNQGFTDKTLDPWQKRSQPAPRNEGRNLLTDTGALQNSLTITSQTFDNVSVTAVGVPYAAAHNYGTTITVTVTEEMRRYFWYMWYKTSDDAYKWMALTTKSRFEIEIPQRQFMGYSKVMMDRIDQQVKERIDEIFRKT